MNLRHRLKHLPRTVDRHRIWCVAAVLLIYLAGINGQWRLGPDTTRYATIGLNLVEGVGFTDPTGLAENAPPGLPLLFAANFKVFGADQVWPIVVVMSLISVGNLVLTYCLFRLHDGRATGLIVALLLAVCANFYRHSLEVLTEMPFVFGLLLMLIGHERHERHVGRPWQAWTLVGAGFVIMVLFRFVAIIVVIAYGMALLWQAVRDRRRAPLLAMGAIVVGVVLFRLFGPRASDSEGLTGDELHVLALVVNNLPATLRSAWETHLPRLLVTVGPEALFGNKLGLDFVGGYFTVVTLLLGMGLAARRPVWGLLVLLFTVQWVLFGSDIRYFLPILPLLAFTWWKAARWIMTGRPGRLATAAALATLVIWVGMNLPRTIGFTAQQRAVPFLAHYQNGVYVGTHEMARVLAAKTEPDARILSDWRQADPLSFFSRRTVVADAQFLEADDTAPPYVVAPIEAAQQAWLDAAGWTRDQTLAEVARSAPLAALSLHRIHRPTIDTSGVGR